MDRQQAFAAIDRINANCSHCIFPELCMWTGIPAGDLELLDRQPYTHLIVRQGESNFHAVKQRTLVWLQCWERLRATTRSVARSRYFV